jgi:hypothetical protein
MQAAMTQYTHNSYSMDLLTCSGLREAKIHMFSGNKMWCINRMEYYSDTKNEILLVVATGMYLKVIMLNKN